MAAERKQLAGSRSSAQIIIGIFPVAGTIFVKLKFDSGLCVNRRDVSGDIFIRFGTENNPERRIVTLTALQFVIHPDIHIHLSDILMCDLICLKVNQNKTFKDIIVKDKVDIVIIQFCTDMLLARDSVLTLHP